MPRRIEVYDNSHIMGTNAVGAMIVAGPEGFQKNQYRKFNIRSADLTPGDDFAMMREVLERRFKRLLSESPRAMDVPADVAGAVVAGARWNVWPHAIKPQCTGGAGDRDSRRGDTLAPLAGRGWRAKRSERAG